MAKFFFRGPSIGMAGVSDAERAAQAMDELRTRAAELEDPEIAGWIGEVDVDPTAKGILEVVFSNSPFLTHCALAEIPFLKDIVRLGPDTALEPVFARMKDELGRLLDQDQLMRELRIARRRVALAVALADITYLWTLERVTQTLSDFADSAVSAAISHLLLQAAEKGDLVLRDEYFPEDDCGYVALAMGKHGARELNYSSDIDLIILYEPMKVDYRGSKSVQEAFIRMTQRLVAILDQRTVDGYVCRVDLRLRPDPGSTPIAIPCAAARAYYDSRGENWERAAMIKARPAAGDMALGREFLGELKPFIWREHLDFWALREIRKIKRQIHAQRGGSEIGFLGHNIKLGRGGIREIEFFAQTQQLIFAGRDPYLRCQRTVDALTTLAEAEFIDDAVADELTESYEFLRKLEHRLQMVADQQTQTLPSDEAKMEELAIFMGFGDIDEFRDIVLGHLAQVETHFTDLFEEAPDPTEQEALNFDSDEPDEQTATLLQQFGYRDVPNTYRRLRRWHVGDLVATQEDREKNLLIELISPLVEKAARTSEPDGVIENLDSFFDRLTPGTRCLSLLAANLTLLDFLIEIVITAPPLAATLGRRPEQLELAVSPGFFNLLPDRRLILADSAYVLDKAADIKEMVELASNWASDHKFQIAANVLRHTMDSSDAGQAFSGIADALCHHVYRRLVGDLERESGSASVDIAVVAYGPFGTQELTYRSPLDLLFVFEADADATGASSSLPTRFMETLAAQIAHERLYDTSDGINLWNRPGPVVTSLDGLPDLCANDASDSRLLALMQARVIAGPSALALGVSRTLKDFLAKGPNSRPIAGDVAQRWQKGSVDREPPPKWDLRRRPGGLDDLEILVRILQLRYAPDHLEVLTPTVAAALGSFSDSGLMEDALVRDLLRSHHLLRQIENVMAIAVDDRLDVDGASQEFKANLPRAAGMDSFDHLEAALNDTFELVQTTFRNLAEDHRGTAH